MFRPGSRLCDGGNCQFLYSHEWGIGEVERETRGVDLRGEERHVSTANGGVRDPGMEGGRSNEHDCAREC